MDVINFTFDKPFYRQTEMLVKLSMSEACLKRYMKEVIDSRGEKGTLTEMGYMKFEGYKEACWIPGLLLNWLIENKLEAIPKYDYELAEQKRVSMGVINFNKQQLKRKAKNEQ